MRADEVSQRGRDHAGNGVQLWNTLGIMCEADVGDRNLLLIWKKVLIRASRYSPPPLLRRVSKVAVGKKDGGVCVYVLITVHYWTP